MSDGGATPEKPLPSGTQDRFHIYVDGSHDPRLGHGGWAFVVHDGGKEVATGSGLIQGGDNGTAEVTALLKALDWISSNAGEETVTIWSDSWVVVNGCNLWRHIWRSSGWRRRSGGGRGRIRPVPHAELWSLVDSRLSCANGVSIAWCKGHGETQGNIRADELARQGRLSRPGTARD